MSQKQLLPAFFMAIILMSCDPSTRVPTRYKPVLMDRSELESSLEMLDPKPVRRPGDLYLEGGLLLVGDKYNGIHFINNSDPKSPTDIGYLRVPGNTEFEIDQQRIYLDSGPDLVILEWDGGGWKEISRIRDLFPELPPPDRGMIPYEFSIEGRPENTVIVAWQE